MVIDKNKNIKFTSTGIEFYSKINYISVKHRIYNKAKVGKKIKINLHWPNILS